MDMTAEKALPAALTPTSVLELTPGQLRTARATAVLIRKTDERYAERLRSHGWVCLPPEHGSVEQNQT